MEQGHYVGTDTLTLPTHSEPPSLMEVAHPVSEEAPPRTEALQGVLILLETLPQLPLIATRPRTRVQSLHVSGSETYDDLRRSSLYTLQDFTSMYWQKPEEYVWE